MSTAMVEALGLMIQQYRQALEQIADGPEEWRALKVIARQALADIPRIQRGTDTTIPPPRQ